MDAFRKSFDEIAADFAALKTTIHGELEFDGVSMGIEATGLEHMAEILAATLPDEDPQKGFIVKVDDMRIAFTCTGTYWEIA